MIDAVISLCKRRGFVFPSSEIYGGLSAVYDYGPYGVELVNNIKAHWWKWMVQYREDIVGLDSAIFMHPRIWEASGHVGGFSDPLAECKQCHNRLRVDHVLEELGVQSDENMSEEEINTLFNKHKEKIKCPKCGTGNFSDVKKFNLLVESNLGNFTGDASKEPVYLRGETCQGIYVNYKNILDTSRVKMPFGVAQIGKAFRNEITARQFIFRTREFEQMEMQYFVHPDKEMDAYEELKNYRWEYYKSLGIKEENLRWKKHDNLVFYAKEAYDIEYNYPFGFKELEGVHARGNYDLIQHSTHCGKSLEYVDQQTKEKYMPHIVESSVGVGRTLLALLVDAYTEEQVEDDTRVVLKLNPALSPIKAAIMPLQKNKPEIVALAKKIFADLKKERMCEYDETGSIGKRYRRQDEIGTPYCITVDFDSLEDNCVTVRERDSMKQERIAIPELEEFLHKNI